MLIRLETQKLLLVVPFVERARLVESLVTLQPDKLRTEHVGQHLGHFGLARTRRPFNEQRLVERECEKNRGLDALVGDVACAPQAFADEFGDDVHRARVRFMPENCAWDSELMIRERLSIAIV